MLRSIKKIIRINPYAEFIFYWIQNNIFPKILNFEGSGTRYNTLNSTCFQVLKIFKKYISNVNIKKANKILEIGCGFSLVPIAKTAATLNASHVYAYDKKNLVKNNDRIVAQKLKALKIYKRVKLITGSFKEIEKVSKNQKFDCVFSNSVLEHALNLKDLILKIGKITRKNGVSFHVIDFRNHNRFQKFGSHYFLTISKKNWQRLGSNVGAPNRKGLTEICNYFKTAGFKILKIKKQKYSKKIIKKALLTCPGKDKKDLEVKVAFLLAKKIYDKKN